MGYEYTFAGVSTLQTPQLDVVFNEAGLLGTVPCTVSGTNTLALTPLTTPTVGTPPFALQSQLRVSGVAANTNTGATTANVAAGGALNVYKDSASGPVALSGNEIVAGNYFVLAYDATLNSNAGGWHLENGLVSGAPTGSAGGDLSGSYPNPTVTKINGAALSTTTSTSGNILVGQGANWLTRAVSGDASLASSGALTVSKTGGVAFSGLATATYVAPTSWTPTDASGATLSFSSVNANYTRNANMLFVYGQLTYPSTADTSHAILGGLPVAVPNQTYAKSPAAVSPSGGSTALILVPIPNTSTAGFQNMMSGANIQNAALSTLTISFLLIYPAA